MLRVFVLFVLVIFVIGCASQPAKKYSGKGKKPNGQWIYSNPIPESKTEMANYTQEQWKQLFDSTIQSCEAAALKAPISRPKCKASKPIMNCTPSKSVQGSFCSKSIVNHSCDIKSTQRYNKALFDHVKSCMTVSGWKWLSNDDPNLALQRIIESIPELLDWQMNSPDKWQLVASIDQKLMTLSEYQNMPTRERLLIVVDKVKQAVQ